MTSNFKFIQYFNILQNFVQNVRKPKWPSILRCVQSLPSPNKPPQRRRYQKYETGVANGSTKGHVLAK